MHRLLLALLLALLFVAVASPALANPQKAAVHNRQAKAYFDAKQYDEAITEFKKSYELDQKPLTLFKIASAYYAKGDYKLAIDFYQQYQLAEPNGAFVTQAAEFTTIATKAIADAEAKQKAAVDAARLEAERKAAEVEKERKRLAVVAIVKQAEAYAHAKAWAAAAKEYGSAAELAEDPAYLIEAAEAYRKAPDLPKALRAYQQFTEHVPIGPKSDEIRAKIADVTREIEKADADERERQKRLGEALVNKPEPSPAKPLVRSRRGWVVVGGGLLLTGLIADLLPANSDNGRLDASDFVPLTCYGLGATAIWKGVF